MGSRHPFFFEVQGDGAMRMLMSLFRDSRAATAIEYGLIATFIAIAAITAMKGLGTKVSNTFNNVSNNLNRS